MPDVPRCGAETRSGDPCKHPAGWGTDHRGEGRCKHHGGASSGAPSRNKNAVTTGEHETIYADALADEERDLYDELDTDHLARLDHEIRLIAIRERRMLHRIKEIQDEELTVVGRKEEAGVTPSAGSAVEVDTTTTQFRSVVDRIQSIEEALTRVQREHRQLLKTKYKMLKDQPADQSEKLQDVLDRFDDARSDADEYTPPELA